MAISNSYAEYVIEQLSQHASVSAKRMFGGMGLYADGFFFALIDDDQLYFKVNDSNRSDYESNGMKPFQPFADKPMTMQYYQLPESILEDSDKLRVWMKKSIDVAKQKSTERKSIKKVRATLKKR